MKRIPQDIEMKPHTRVDESVYHYAHQYVKHNYRSME